MRIYTRTSYATHMAVRCSDESTPSPSRADTHDVIVPVGIASGVVKMQLPGALMTREAACVLASAMFGSSHLAHLDTPLCPVQYAEVTDPALEDQEFVEPPFQLEGLFGCLATRKCIEIPVEALRWVSGRQ